MLDPIDRKIVLVTLCLVILGVVLAMLKGLFTPLVDNDKIFAIIGPAFGTILGFLGGMLANNGKRPDLDQEESK